MVPLLDDLALDPLDTRIFEMALVIRKGFIEGKVVSEISVGNSRDQLMIQRYDDGVDERDSVFCRQTKMTRYILPRCDAQTVFCVHLEV